MVALNLHYADFTKHFDAIRDTIMLKSVIKTFKVLGDQVEEAQVFVDAIKGAAGRRQLRKLN